MVANVLRLKEPLWERLSVLIPEPAGRGRRPDNAKGCLEGILYVLRTGCQWDELPKCYPPKSTVHDRLKAWAERGILEKLWQTILIEYDDLKGIGWEWLSADGCITKAPLGGEATGKKSDGQGKARHQKTCAL